MTIELGINEPNKKRALNRSFGPKTLMNLLQILLLAGLTGCCFAALPTCSSPGCPPGGIWSEWVTTENCSASCGSCGTQYYTRTCQSTSVNCSCVGDTSRYTPCNTQACIYPAQRTCCIPYLSMLINGSMQCGPLPKSTDTTTPCCPNGGLWSAWSGWNRDPVTSNFIQTRSCVSEEMGCPCTGSTNNTVTGCPCGSMVTPASVVSSCSLNHQYFASTTTSINSTSCIMTATLLANNDDLNQRSCSAYTTWQPYNFTAVVSFYAPSNSNQCPQDRPFNCQDRKDPGEDGTNLPITFTCDVDSGKWRYDMYGYLVDGFVQIMP